MMLQTIKQQLIAHQLITKQEIDNLLPQSMPEEECLYNLITHLSAALIEQKEHSEQINHEHAEVIREMNQTVVKNNNTILSGLQIFCMFTQQLGQFSRVLYQANNKGTNNKKDLNRPSIEVYKHFRTVYEMAEELSTIFNLYHFAHQEMQQKRDELLSMQIKCMEDVIMTQQNYQQQQDTESQHQTQQAPSYSANYPSNQNLPQQTQEYILSLRQQITHLHQTLLKNDDEFTQQIQNYNKTIRQLSQTVKAYEIELAKIIQYEMKIQDLERAIVRFREEKYRNQIVIENMAKKIRNYEKSLKGDQAFLSPQRQRLMSSPESRFSTINSKVSNTLSVVNSINNSPRNRTSLLSPGRRGIF